MRDVILDILNSIGLLELGFIFGFYVIYIVRRIYFFFTKRSVIKNEKNI